MKNLRKSLLMRYDTSNKACNPTYHIQVDMQRRKIIVSMTGPWGTDNRPTYVKAYIEFSPSYPDAVMPSVSLEKTADLGEDVANKLSSDVSEITANFLSRQRSSLEAILRYLLGEQSLEESLLWLKKRQQSLELDSALEVGLSSSDEDDEMLEKYAGSKVDDMESSNPMIAKSRTQNNPPLPKACGALWADDGRLVCFFPPRQDKESSLLGLNFKADERSSKTRKSIFEGFGRFNGTSYRKRQTGSTLETIESGGSDSEEYLSSSSGTSSASDDIGLPRHHFMPSMAWRGDASEALPYVSLNESQKSSNGMEKAKSTSSREKNFVSIHDYRDLLPAKECLARNYIIGNGSRGNRHNADTARETGDVILADVWLFVDLILQDNVPLEVMNHGQSFDRTRDTDTPAIDPILMIARRASSKLTVKDSAIDLTFDGTQKEHPLTAPASIKWGHHPLSRRYLVDAL